MTPTRTALASRTRLSPDDIDPLDSLGPGGFAWFTDELQLATSGVAARVAVADADELLRSIEVDDVEDKLRWPGIGPLAVGALGFDGTRALVIPARSGPGAWPDHWGWRTTVEEALRRIADGRLEKVVLAREVVLQTDLSFDVAGVLDRLRTGNPQSFTYAAGSFVGASPELLLRRRGARVMSKPMAGTVARGRSPADDDRLAATMTTSVKERAEHRLVVGEVVRRLAAVCDDVVVDHSEVVRLPTVAHLATTIRGTLRNGFSSALGLAALLHPTPAVAGTPRTAALDAIAELEPFDRGLYAGPIGWVDARGDGDWAIALRGASLSGNRARLIAGAGIVEGSDPEAEWAETEAKLDAMRSVLLDH